MKQFNVSLTDEEIMIFKAGHTALDTVLTNNQCRLLSQRIESYFQCIAHTSAMLSDTVASDPDLSVTKAKTIMMVLSAALEDFLADSARVPSAPREAPPTESPPPQPRAENNVVMFSARKSRPEQPPANPVD